MKNDTLDVATRTPDRAANLANPLLAFARRLATGVSEYRKRRELERNLYLMQRVFGEIPTHVLEDIGITEYQAEEILAQITHGNTILLHPLFPRGK